MTLIPPRFLFRVSYSCPYVTKMPRDDGDELLLLPDECRIENFDGVAGRTSFADVRIGWNELGIGFQVEVSGKKKSPSGDHTRPRASDGVTLWIDTRDSRASHRASRYCHQFHMLPTGGGPDRDEPSFQQQKIYRALHDAPLSLPSEVAFRSRIVKGGYSIEVFLPLAVLHGLDPDQNRRLGFYYAVRDQELGDQVLQVGSEFPFGEDPSLWSVQELK